MPKKSDQAYKGRANSDVLSGNDEAENSLAHSIPIDSITLPPSQPRRYFDEAAMQSLVESVKTDGILQPLLVRPVEEGKYELVAGERRLRAAKAAGLTEVPAIVRELTERQALQLALVENLQREDLNPVEETEGILQLLSHELESSPEEVVRLLYRMLNDLQRGTDNVISQPEGEAVSRVFADLGRMSWESFISNRLSLLKLQADILDALRQGRIEYTKARALAKVKDEEARKSLLETAIAEELSLTQIKERVAPLRTGVREEKPEENLKAQIKAVLTKANKSKAWSDPKKRNRLQKILAELESLLAD
ncbi:MAG: ParB/RepB/Spo0J family partition protein [Oscillatoria princeps RMCB-10]|jgi:ParB family chromosome partitioning protein|nr:ParB/RepB/Spo0J family partition protein [Oscillatoria princeps RMCB-10]